MPIDIVTQELDFEPKRVSHPSPLVLQVQPQNNISSFNLSQTATYGPVSFLIPARVLSLSDSELEWQLTIPGTASNYNWIQANVGCQLSRLTLTSQSTNQVLFDLSNCDRFCSGVVPLAMKDEDLKNKYSSLFTSGASAAIPTLQTSADTAPNKPISMVNQANSIANPDGIAVEYSGAYTGKRELYVSSATNTSDRVNVSLKLGDIPLSIFALKKLLYFGGENLMLDCYFSPVNRFAWIGTSPTNPTTGAAATAVTVAVSSLQMKLQTEQNQEIVREIVGRINSSGMQMNFCYPYCYKSNLSGVSQSINLNLSRGFGSRLLCGIMLPYNGTESINTAQDHSAYSSLIANNTACNYNTYMDQVPILTNSNIDVWKNETYFYNKDHLRNSIIKSAQQYGVDFAQIDMFAKNALCEIDQTIEDGLSLEPNRQYSLQVNATGSGNTVNWYIFLICQKQLVLTGAGAQVI